MLIFKKKKLIIAVLIFLPVCIYFFQPRVLSTLRLKIVALSTGPIQFVTTPFTILAKEFKKIIYYHKTFEEYRRLSKEAPILKARLIAMEELIRENSRLEQLLGFKRQLVYSSLAAHVIGREPTLWNSSMIIDRGKADGIKKGMPVVNAYGIVGKIIDVADQYAKVILLSDPQFSVAGLLKRSGESVLVSGSLLNHCRVTYIDSKTDVYKGEQVVTSKLSSSFPEGLLIGTIVEVQKNTQKGSVECILEPAVSFSSLEEVLVIKINH